MDALKLAPAAHFGKPSEAKALNTHPGDHKQTDTVPSTTAPTKPKNAEPVKNHWTA